MSVSVIVVSHKVFLVVAIASRKEIPLPDYTNILITNSIPHVVVPNCFHIQVVVVSLANFLILKNNVKNLLLQSRTMTQGFRF